jgi:molecular chaperone DnaK
LRRTDNKELIRIPLVQGERRRGNRNQEVGMLVIRPRDLRIDLPKGSDVEVTFTATTSNLLAVIADVPLLDTQFEAEIDFTGTRAQAAEVLEVLLVDTQERMDRLRPQVERAGAPDAKRLLGKLDEENALEVAREQVRAARVDPGAAKYAEDRLRDIQADLDDIEDAIGLSELAQELQDMLNGAERLVDDVGSRSDRQELETLNARAREAIRSQDAAAVRTQLDQTIAFLVELERRAPDWPIKLFYGLVHQVPSSSAADSLISKGKRAASAGDVRTLGQVNQDLFSLLPADQQPKSNGHIGLVWK